MSSSATHGTRTTKRPASWWQPPLVSMAVASIVLPIAIFLGLWSGMATDSCSSAGDCPNTFAALARTWWLIVACVVTAVLQWLPAYWMPRKGRLLLAAVPPVLAFAAIASVFATPAGQ